MWTIVAVGGVVLAGLCAECLGTFMAGSLMDAADSIATEFESELIATAPEAHDPD